MPFCDNLQAKQPIKLTQWKAKAIHDRSFGSRQWQGSLVRSQATGWKNVSFCCSICGYSPTAWLSDSYKQEWRRVAKQTVSGCKTGGFRLQNRRFCNAKRHLWHCPMAIVIIVYHHQGIAVHIAPKFRWAAQRIQQAHFSFMTQLSFWIFLYICTCTGNDCHLGKKLPCLTPTPSISAEPHAGIC